MVNSFFSLDSKGMFIWGIIVVVLGVIFGEVIKEL
jgi:membrane protein DedA with SNARE-associated domain